MRKAPSAVPARRHFAAQVFAMSGGDGLRLSLEPLLACHQTTLGWAIPCMTQCLAGQHRAATVEGWELCSVYASSTRHKAGSEELCGLCPVAGWWLGLPSPSGMVPLVPGGSAGRGPGSEHHSWLSAPTHLPALPSPSACLLPSTSCLILSLETFRYLSQLHTWKKREWEVGEVAAMFPGYLLPAWSTQPHTGHPQQRLGSPLSHASWQRENEERHVPLRGGWQNGSRHKFGSSQATRTSSPEALHLYSS